MFKKIAANKYVRISLKVAGLFFVLIIVLFVVAAAYIHFNKDSITEKIKTQIAKSINGSITINDVDISDRKSVV